MCSPKLGIAPSSISEFGLNAVLLKPGKVIQSLSFGKTTHVTQKTITDCAVESAATDRRLNNED
jgi:hypothetical protein